MAGIGRDFLAEKAASRYYQQGSDNLAQDLGREVKAS